MLLILIFDAMVSLLAWVIGLVPLPALSEIFPQFQQYIDYVVGLLPSAISLFRVFIGDEAFGIIRFIIQFYVTMGSFILVLFSVSFVFWVIRKVKSLPFVG